MCAIAAFMTFPAYAQNSFARGEAIYLENKPQEALFYVEAAVREDPAHVRAFLYLGIAYQQLNRNDEAIAVYQRILPRGGAETARLAFNLGNAYFSTGNPTMAVQYYTRALEAEPAFSTALLNRANAKVQMGELKDAVFDYENYLLMEPRSVQRGQIERLIAFIKDEYIAEERRIAAEELRRQEERAAEEARRQAVEEAARLEAERRRRLLEEVAASLQAAAEDNTSLSAGNEGVQGNYGEFELD